MLLRKISFCQQTEGHGFPLNCAKKHQTYGKSEVSDCGKNTLRWRSVCLQLLIPLTWLAKSSYIIIY